MTRKPEWGQRHINHPGLEPAARRELILARYSFLVPAQLGEGLVWSFPGLLMTNQKLASRYMRIMLSYSIVMFERQRAE